MRPLRRTILQFSQMRLTLERTFMTTAALPATRRSGRLRRMVPSGRSSIGGSIQIGIGRPRPSRIHRAWPSPADTASGRDCPGTESRDYRRDANLATSKAEPKFESPADSIGRPVNWVGKAAKSRQGPGPPITILEFAAGFAGRVKISGPSRRQSHAVLEMDAGLAVLGPHRPVVLFAGASPLRAGVDHRLDRQDEPRFERKIGLPQAIRSRNWAPADPRAFRGRCRVPRGPRRR